MKDPEKSRARNRESYMKDPEKSHVDIAAQSRESYKKDLEKSRDDSTARSHESYLKDPEKSCTKPRKLHEGSGKESCHRRRKQILFGG